MLLETFKKNHILTKYDIHRISRKNNISIFKVYKTLLKLLKEDMILKVFVEFDGEDYLLTKEYTLDCEIAFIENFNSTRKPIMSDKDLFNLI